MSIFEFVKSHVDIVDVVSTYVRLKKMGNYWKGSCPFHKENDASFTVSPDKQIFYCFGCHESGDLISFVAKHEALSPIESLSSLIEKYDLKIPQELLKESGKFNSNRQAHNAHFELSKLFAHYARTNLEKNPAALSYLEKRGVSKTQIERFCIGILPSGRASINGLVAHARKAGFLSKDLINAGILIESRSTTYPPFEDRILFPIRDISGKFVAFGGRVYQPRDTRPKYYNSKESECFLKRQLLFGIDLARPILQSTGIGYLVEGYLDCIAMSQYGYVGTVATLGTSCTDEHLKLLSRYIHTLFVVYDGDNAGTNAIIRLAERCWQTDIELQIITLPEGEDPASLLTSETPHKNIFKNTEHIFDFFVKSTGKGYLKKTLSQKIQTSKKIINLITKVTNPIKQDLLLQQAAQSMQVPFTSLKSTCTNPNTTQTTDVKTSAHNKVSLEEKIFFISLCGADAEKNVTDFIITEAVIQYFPKSWHNMLQLLLKMNVHEQGKAGVKKFLNTLTEKERNKVLLGLFKHEPETTPMHFKQLLSLLASKHWKEAISIMKNKVQIAQKQGDSKRVEQLLLAISKMNHMKQ